MPSTVYLLLLLLLLLLLAVYSPSLFSIVYIPKDAWIDPEWLMSRKCRLTPEIKGREVHSILEYS